MAPDLQGQPAGGLPCALLVSCLNACMQRNCPVDVCTAGLKAHTPFPASSLSWPQTHISRASSPAPDSCKQQVLSQQQTAGAEELTLADQAKGRSSDSMACDEEAGPQATSTLKPTGQVGLRYGLNGLLG